MFGSMPDIEEYRKEEIESVKEENNLIAKIKIMTNLKSKVLEATDGGRRIFED